MKNLIMLLLAIITVYGCEKEVQHRNSASADAAKFLKTDPKVEAFKILKRAKEMCVYIKDTAHKRLILEGLNMTAIVQADQNNQTKIDSNIFSIFIANPKFLPRQENIKTGDVYFLFDADFYVKERKFVFRMNDQISQLSSNMDAKACFLIHEFYHALQVGICVFTGRKITNDDMFHQENQAWYYSTMIYKSAHPELFVHDCNCGDFKSSNGDAAISSFIFYDKCGEKYLRTLYDEKGN